MKDWDDYRYFLAVAEAGTLSAAAQALGASQPTIGRRVAELEKRLEAKLFHRSPSGYQLTELGQQVHERVKAIDKEAQWIERKVSYSDRVPEGRVVLTTTEDIGYFCLAPLLGRFHEQHPEIDLDLIIAYHAVDLLSGEADIALRVGNPKSAQLVGRRLCKLRFGLFASKEYLARHPVPRTVEDLNHHSVIESVRQLNNFAQTTWLRRHSEQGRVAFSCDNLMVQLSALEAGLGIIALPHYMLTHNSKVRTLLADQFELALDLWMLTPRDLRRVPRVRAVLDFLSAQLPELLDPPGGIRARPA